MEILKAPRRIGVLKRNGRAAVGGIEALIWLDKQTGKVLYTVPRLLSTLTASQ